MRKTVILFLALLLVAGCGGKGGFEIIKKPKAESEGFLDPDTLQIIGIGYPSPSQADPLKRKKESFAAAMINARMRVIDYFVGQLMEAKDEEHYKALVMRVGNFAVSRYEPIFSNELKKGGSQVDAFFDMLGIRGYAHKTTYDAKTHKTWIAYRVVQAGLLGKAKSGFTE